jgi:hypothetical protein
MIKCRLPALGDSFVVHLLCKEGHLLVADFGQG